MNKWNIDIIENLVDIIDYRGKTPEKSEFGVPTLSAKSVKMNYIDYSNAYFISQETYKKFMVRGFPQVGDVLMTTEAPLGCVAKLDRDDVGIAQRLLTLRGKTNVIENGFLLYYLQSPIGQHKLNERATGTTVTGIKQKEFRQMEISYPNFQIQTKIAKILSSIDDKIEINNKINDNLEKQAQAVFKSWFVDFEPFGGVMPSDWEVGTFSKMTIKTIGGDWGKDSPTVNYKKHTFCIRGADIPDIRVGKKGKIPTRYILEKNFANKRLTVGDIVVEISGGSPTQSTGRVAVISKGLLSYFNEEIICTNFCRALTPKLGYSMFMYYYWQYLYDLKLFFSYENGTTGIKNLDVNGFLDTEIINIPSLSKVKEFDVICQIIHHKIYNNGNETERLNKLRDTLLPRLMTGEIDVSQIEI